MVKKLWQYVKPFSSDTGTSRTDRQNCYINIARQCAQCWRAIKIRKYRKLPVLTSQKNGCSNLTPKVGWTHPRTSWNCMLCDCLYAHYHPTLDGEGQLSRACRWRHYIRTSDTASTSAEYAVTLRSAVELAYVGCNVWRAYVTHFNFLKCIPCYSGRRS